MGCFDVFCTLCGVPMNTNCNIYNKKTYEVDTQETNKWASKTKWINKCVVLLNNNAVIHDMQNTSCADTFKSIYPKKNEGEYDVIPIRTRFMIDALGRTFNIGLAVHEDCYNFIKKKFDIELKYSHFPTHLFKTYTYYIPSSIKYGFVEKCWGQDFDFNLLLSNNKMDLVMSPLVNKQKQAQVIKIFNQLKIRKGRSSPASSASLYANGTIKLGEDDNLWNVKSKKWIKINNDDILVFKHSLKYEKLTNKSTANVLKYLQYLPMIGEASKTIFLNNLTVHTKKNKIIDIEILGVDEKEIDKIKKYFGC